MSQEAIFDRELAELTQQRDRWREAARAVMNEVQFEHYRQSIEGDTNQEVSNDNLT